ncbi:Pyridoxal phosphate-dependent transferase, major domain [Sesbania bispinosa]|nr:Pyridoxal phosphate-dependent transferase, major domain [Sesbania bispinosa]
MFAVHISVSHSTCPSSHTNKLGQLLNAGTPLQRHVPHGKVHCPRSVWSACLNVGVGAPQNASAAVEVNSGKKTKEVIEDEGRFLVGTYARAPLVLERGTGCKVYDVEGKEYLDLSAGIAVNALGHGDVDWLKAVVEQAGKLTHVSNIYHSAPQVWPCS